MPDFRLKAPFGPKGDQAQAIEKLSRGVLDGQRAQTLLGVTGSGKTYTMAAVIERINRPTLVISHNKTLAAQLYREFAEFFPDNAVEYFVSYYDYYQPEAYLPSTDTYIEKDFSINDEIDRMRLRCQVGEEYDRDFILRKLIDIQYSRNDYEFSRSTFRVRGDVVEILPSYSKNGVRLELFGDELEKIYIFNPLSGEIIEERERIIIYPASHYVVDQVSMQAAMGGIAEELEIRHRELLEQHKLLEAQRLKTRTEYDLEMMREVGYCNGIENYSRHIFGRDEGERPAVLLDYFPENFLMFIDESHVTVPQLGGMYEGDRSRKLSLVEHGFRLPSALDNRPLYFEEIDGMVNKVIFVSATPADYERRESTQIVEQIIRPTGLLDPRIELRDSNYKID
ncbi:MAG: DEAD/DEAH box helicase family protein, partial [bacterium]